MNFRMTSLPLHYILSGVSPFLMTRLKKKTSAYSTCSFSNFGNLLIPTPPFWKGVCEYMKTICSEFLLDEEQLRLTVACCYLSLVTLISSCRWPTFSYPIWLCVYVRDVWEGCGVCLLRGSAWEVQERWASHGCHFEVEEQSFPWTTVPSSSLLPARSD